MDINKLSMKELHEVITAATRRRKVLAKRKPVQKVRASILKYIKTTGYTFDELFGSASVPAAPKAGRKKGAKAGKKVAPKYFNPENPTETWSGRGIKPKWLAQKLAEGHRLESLEIQGQKSSPQAEEAAREEQAELPIT